MGTGPNLCFIRLYIIHFVQDLLRVWLDVFVCMCLLLCLCIFICLYFITFNCININPVDMMMQVPDYRLLPQCCAVCYCVYAKSPFRTKGHQRQRDPVTCPDTIWWILMSCSEIQMVLHCLLMHTSCSPNVLCWYMKWHRVMSLKWCEFRSVCKCSTDYRLDFLFFFFFEQMLIISLVLDQLSWFSESLLLSVVLSRPLSPARLTAGAQGRREVNRCLKWMPFITKSQQIFYLCNSIRVVAYHCHCAAAAFYNHDVLVHK